MDDAKATTDGTRDRTEATSEPGETAGNSEAGTSDMDAWTTSTGREEGLVPGEGGGAADTDER